MAQNTRLKAFHKALLATIHFPEFDPDNFENVEYDDEDAEEDDD